MPPPSSPQDDSEPMTSGEAVGDARDPFLGTVVDGITLVRRIGAGGFGIVYEGRQRAAPHVVAVKVISPRVVTPGLVRRFETGV